MDQDREKKLVTQAISGDKQSFATLYRMWVTPIYAYIYVRVSAKQDAEDLTEKVFLKAMKAITSFKHQSSFATWIYTIARNQIIDFYRTKKLQPIHLDDINQIAQPNIEQETHHHQQNNEKKITTILTKLPQDYAQILKLRFIQNLTIKQTAQTLGITENNVKVRQLRALKKAREITINHE